MIDHKGCACPHSSWASSLPQLPRKVMSLNPSLPTRIFSFLIFLFPPFGASKFLSLYPLRRRFQIPTTRINSYHLQVIRHQTKWDRLYQGTKKFQAGLVSNRAECRGPSSEQDGPPALPRLSWFLLGSSGGQRCQFLLLLVCSRTAGERVSFPITLLRVLKLIVIGLTMANSGDPAAMAEGKFPASALGRHQQDHSNDLLKGIPKKIG